MQLKATAQWLACVGVLGVTCSAGGQDDVPQVQLLENHAGSVLGLAFTPDGRTLASSSRDDTICVWDAATGELKRRLSHHTDDVYGLAYSPDGRLLVSGSADHTICLWAVPAYQVRRTLTGHEDVVRWTAFSQGRLWSTIAGWTSEVRRRQVQQIRGGSVKSTNRSYFT